MATNRDSNPRTKLDRKTVEKNRRIQMKGLISELTSLVPPQHFKPSKEMLSQRDQIDQVPSYIKGLNERVDRLKKRIEMAKSKCFNSNHDIPNVEYPMVQIQEMGSCLQVVLISGMRNKFRLHEVIKVLEEQGLEVNCASISTVDQIAYHILHAEVRFSRLGVDSSMIYDRLLELFLLKII